jgi:hypothetical protein
MKLRVYFPMENRANEGYAIYTASSYAIIEGYLYIHLDSDEPFHPALAVYAPGFWSTVEYLDKLDKESK